MTLDLELLREAYRDDRLRTHAETCYLWHVGCAVLRLCAEVEALRAENARLRGEATR